MTVTETKRMINRAVNFFSTLRSVDADMPTQTAHVLLTVANHPGISSPDIITKTGISQSAMSRHLGILSEYSEFRGREGYGFVVSVPDPNNRRQKLNSLTPKGKQFVARLLATLDPDVEIDIK